MCLLVIIIDCYLLLNFIQQKCSKTIRYLNDESLKIYLHHIYKHSGRQLGYLQCIITINCHCRDLTHFMSHLYVSTIFPLCYRPEATCFKYIYFIQNKRIGHGIQRNNALS